MHWQLLRSPDHVLTVGMRTREPMPPLPEPKALACGVSYSGHRGGCRDMSGVQSVLLQCWHLVDAGQPQRPRKPRVDARLLMQRLRGLPAYQL